MSATDITSSDKEAAKKKARKEAMKAEAQKLGISYEEYKAQQKKEKKAKKNSSESRQLEDAPKQQEEKERKRLRTYSEDVQDDAINAKRRRTRSMDEKEVQIQEQNSDLKLSTIEWRSKHTMMVRKSSDSNYSPPEPFRKFSDAPFSADIQTAISRAGYEYPTHIQAQAWPIALQGSDLISIAKTGSGKTCGFLLPALHQYLSNKKHRQSGKPMMLVLAPTRELAQQILTEVMKFGRTCGVRSICCYGGAPKYPQIQSLKRGVEVIIATPGRLNDLLEAKCTSLDEIQFLVLDEADRMLDMGFEPQIRQILGHIPQKHQTLLFSATWPKEIQALAREFLTDPVHVNVGELNALNANQDIKQHVLLCEEHEKTDKLKEILDALKKDAEENPSTSKPVANGRGPRQVQTSNDNQHAKVIVFVSRKSACDQLANQLWDQGYAVDSLHGDRAQWERTKVTNAFKSGALRMLIATDVAARGLDIKDVGVVINFDMPAGTNGVEDYVHRIGRTGRAGAKGVSHTFMTHKDSKCANKLVEVLSKAKQEVPAFLQAWVRPRYGGGGGRGRGGYGRGRGGRGRGGRGGGGGGGRSYMSGNGRSGGYRRSY